MLTKRLATVLGVLALAVLTLAITAWADEGEKATVNTDGLEVHSGMSQGSSVVGSLGKGAEVVVEFEIERTDGAWCSVMEPGQAQAMGYVPCRYLDREASTKFYDRVGTVGGKPAGKTQAPPGAAEDGKRPYSDIKVVMYMTDW